MKDVTLLVWLTQMGLSIALPLGGFIFLALWLHNSCGWGSWVIFAGIGLGLYSAFEGLRASIQAMQLITRKKKDDEPPPVAFNDHH